MVEQIDIAIVGGGPTGLAAAHALSKSLGSAARITMYERTPHIDIKRGAGLGLDINGLQALKGIGQDLLDAVLAQSVQFTSSELRDPKGGVIPGGAAMVAEQMNARKNHPSGLTNIQLGWHELTHTLASMLPEDVELKMGARFLNYDQAPDGSFLLHFESGGEASSQPAATSPSIMPRGVSDHLHEGHQTETCRADVLIAADGYFSPIRQQCVNDGPPPFGGNVVWRARVTGEVAARHGYTPECSVWYQGGGSVAAVYMVSGGDVVWTTSATEPVLEAAGVDWRELIAGRMSQGAQSTNFVTRSRMNGEAAKARLMHVFKEWEQPLQGLLADTDPCSIVEHGLFVRPAADLSPSCYGRGKVVVLGDAAHPMRPTGQGTNQALEDAYHLAAYAERAGGRMDEGVLDAFRAARVERLQPIMAYVEAMGKGAYKTKETEAADKPPVAFNYYEAIFGGEYPPLGQLGTGVV